VSEATLPARHGARSALRPARFGAMSQPITCEHLSPSSDHWPNTPAGCEECLRVGDSWIKARLCLTCGHVGCCDSSKNKHATKHYTATHHPVIDSFEPGDHWRWCYADEQYSRLTS